MWLIDARSYKLKNFQDASQIAKQYAILSHRWEDEEVSHGDMTSRWDRLRLKRMKGWYKIQKCCEQAVKDNLAYAWVDTCCIDKTSSAELQEAINSMFKWYSEAKICYVFLSDVKAVSSELTEARLKELSIPKSFRRSQWFSRGWTLQELLAPKIVTFYDSEWSCLGTRAQHKNLVSEITGIQSECLDGFDPMWTLNSQICIAQVMSWASGRTTTRVEDKAYSLLGIFGVSLPMLYGEGRRAFSRLQEELLNTRDDQSIFAWKALGEHGPLAMALTDTPDDFIRPSQAYRWFPPSETARRKPHVISSDGITLDLLIQPIRPSVYHAFLNTGMINVEEQHLLRSAKPTDVADNGTVVVMTIAFPIQEIGPDGHFVRLVPDNKEGGLIYCAISRRDGCRLRRVTLSSFLKKSEHEESLKEDPGSFTIAGTVTNLWSFSGVHDVIEPPQTWPWQPSETRVIDFREAPSIFGLLTWNGWPHKLYWGYHYLPITAVAFGYDFDFNPACIVVLGQISHDKKGAEQLRAMIEQEHEKTEIKIDDAQKMTVEGGTCELTYFGEDITSKLLRHNEHQDPPMVMLAKTTPSTRRSCKGFHATIHLHNSKYDHYHKAKVHIKVSRESKKVPWDIEISVERSETKIIADSIFPHLTRFVQPRPAYRLGTWDEHRDGTSSVESSSASTILD